MASTARLGEVPTGGDSRRPVELGFRFGEELGREREIGELPCYLNGP
jgi:hypothetical protein